MKKNVIWYEGWVGEFLNVGRNIFFFSFFFPGFIFEKIIFENSTNYS